MQKDSKICKVSYIKLIIRRIKGGQGVRVSFDMYIQKNKSPIRADLALLSEI